MNHLTETGPQPNPLLTTKLYIPRPRRTLVSRPRLTARLNQALECALTLVSAPPGFGKTTLLSEWTYAKDEGDRVAWISLDEDDNDPARFLSYLIAALQTIQPNLGRAVPATFQAQLRPFAPSSAAEETNCTEILLPLINEMATIPHDFVLILDDYHLLTTPAVHEAVTCLLDHLPPPMHLVIAGRTEPPLPLPRLRVRQQLLELGTTDLRFTAQEAATFLNQVMALNLSAAEVAALDTHTEGWVAGLQMAALSMQDCDDIPGFIAGFKGSHRYVFDYLAAEVLHRQPEAIRHFLLMTAILNRLTAPLCEALVRFSEKERQQNDEALTRSFADSQAILEHLEQANLFILPLDDGRRWYRYHHLFADFLRDQLQRQVGAQAIVDLHRRAAEWYEQNDFTAEAMSHALIAGEVERPIRLVEQSGGTMLRQSELSTLLNWLEALPEERVRARPRLSLFQAWALVFSGQLEAVETWLQNHSLVAEEDEIPGELTAVQATVAFFRRDIPQAVALYCEAFDQLPEENLFLRGAVVLSLATAYNLQGDIAGAQWAFEQAGAISRANNNIYMAIVALCNLAHLHVSQAQLHRAAELYRQALQLADQQEAETGSRPPNVGRAHMGLGGVLYEWNDLETAQHHLQTGLAWGRQHSDTMALMEGYLALARIKQAQGELSAAFAAVNQAEAYAQANNLPSWGIRLAACRVQLWLAQDDVEAAARWLKKDWLSLSQDSADDSAGYFDELRRIEKLTQARLFIARQHPDEALEILNPLLPPLEKAELTGYVLEILLLQALAHHLQNNTAKATAALESALLLAEPEGYVRPFVDLGPAMKTLLESIKTKSGRRNAFVDELLKAFPKTRTLQPSALSPQPLIDPLSNRELELLSLIAAGMSNRQIADDLFLTVGTVKWHLSNIYSKLGVNSRTRAVARARELELL